MIWCLKAPVQWELQTNLSAYDDDVEYIGWNTALQAPAMYILSTAVILKVGSMALCQGVREKISYSFI